MKTSSYFLAVSIALLTLFPVSAKTELKHLQCEYKENPVGIDQLRPRLSWQMESTERDVSQSAYEIKVYSAEPGKKKELMWSSGKIISTLSNQIGYQGKTLTSGMRLEWQVRVWDQKNKSTAWSSPANWEMGLLDPSDWNASWIESNVNDARESFRASPMFRKEFSTREKIVKARAYISSRGLYQLFLNGKKVSKDLFTPGWTSYRTRIQYQTYDLTDVLKEENALGIILGDGWYRGRIGFNDQRNYYGDRLGLIFQLHIEYADGSRQQIVSDQNWKWTASPILYSDIYNGESYDARSELPGWNMPGFKDINWKNVEIQPAGTVKLVAPQGVPVRITEKIQPVKIIQTPRGETVFDMGQNMVGWAQIRVKGAAGDKITVQYAEVLDKDGNFYTDNLRGARSENIYILTGKGEEQFEPHFTFHGFRYVKIEGFRYSPGLEAITGKVIHSDMPRTGEFNCSDKLINQLQSNIQWGQRGNFLDVPTDCPQRDERLGWTGDAQVFSPTAAFNFNVAGFYAKWLKDLTIDQLSNGRVPHVIPDVLHGDGGSTAWADVSVIVPWTVYQSYGDIRILEEQYSSMKAWVEYMNTRAGEDHLWTGDFHFGDWLAFASTSSDYPGATTEKDLIATAYFRYSSSLLAKIAGILNKKEDVSYYSKLSDEVKEAFIREFVTPNGRLVSHTQTAYALALSFDLLPEKLKVQAAQYLAQDVERFRHLTTGFVGTPLLCSTLSAIGRDDLAFLLLTRKQYPSWLYPVTQGATTIWERWDGQRTDGSFQDTGMNSFNHYAYGAIGQWLYEHVAGIRIDPNQVGYKHFYLTPHAGGGLTYARASYNSIYGMIISDWKTEGGNISYQIQVPSNTSATVNLKDIYQYVKKSMPKDKSLTAEKANTWEVLLNGKELTTDQIAKLLSEDNGLELGSGEYTLFISVF